MTAYEFALKNLSVRLWLTFWRAGDVKRVLISLMFLLKLIFVISLKDHFLHERSLRKSPHAYSLAHHKTLGHRHSLHFRGIGFSDGWLKMRHLGPEWAWGGHRKWKAPVCFKQKCLQQPFEWSTWIAGQKGQERLWNDPKPAEQVNSWRRGEYFLPDFQCFVLVNNLKGNKITQ